MPGDTFKSLRKNVKECKNKIAKLAEENAKLVEDLVRPPKKIIKQSDALHVKEDETKKNTCTICMDDINVGDCTLMFGCEGKHTFHVSCIGTWAQKSNTFSCPNCRYGKEKSGPPDTSDDEQLAREMSRGTGRPLPMLDIKIPTMMEMLMMLEEMDEQPALVEPSLALAEELPRNSEWDCDRCTYHHKVNENQRRCRICSTPR